MLFENERPMCFDELVGRDKEIKQIKEMIASPNGIPHLLFSGRQGTGKTTIANIIANEVFGKEYKKSNYFEFNASSTRGIEFIRKDIAEIAKRRPMGVPYKIILMDEADNITPDAQASLRRIMEIHAKNTRFIFTCNYPQKIIAPLISRFVSIPFAKVDTKSMGMYLKRISKKHNLGFDDKKLIQFAKMADGDLRLALNNLEGNIDSSVSEFIDNLTLDKINKMSLDDKINKLAFSLDPDYIFTKIWEIVKREKAWDLLLPLADCSFKMNNSLHKTLFLANLLEKFF